jgi:hypothetical protein
MKLIQGTSVVSVDANKAFMFHETVVVGVNTLGAIKTFIDKFDDAVSALDATAVELAIMDALHNYITVAPGVPALDAFDHAMLTGANGLNAVGGEKYGKYVYTEGRAGGGGAVLAPGDNLIMRGGVGNTLAAGHVYEFIRLEGVLVRANAPRRLAARPSTLQYDGLNDEEKRTYRSYKLAARLLTNYPKMMLDFIETVFAVAHSEGDTVEIRFPQGASSQVQVNFSKLQNLAESLMTDVKHYLDLFRSSMPPETYKRFEDRTSPGSVFWLEEHLVDARFRGASDAAADQLNTLDGISRKTSKAFSSLVRTDMIKLNAAEVTVAILTGADGARLAATNSIFNPPVPADLPSKCETYGTTLSQLLWYNSAMLDSGFVNQAALPQVAVNNVAGLGYILGNLILTARHTGVGNPPVPKTAVNQNVGRFQLYTSNQTLQPQTSLLVIFNQLLAKYLATFTDSASSKIYVNLINSLANGVLAKAVTAPAGNSWPDMVSNAANTSIGQRGDPKNGVILFHSLALILQRISRDINPTTQVADHLVSTLTDIPLYMKESYRVNLPGFIRLFNIVVQKAEFIKQLVQKTSINCSRPNLQTITGAGANAKIRLGGADVDVNGGEYLANSLAALDDITAATSDIDMKAKIVSFIDTISSVAYTASSSATDVLKELSDRPLFLQTQESSIETYKVRYGKLPLMPFSFTLHFLGNMAVINGHADPTALLPVSSLGDFTFKFQYGIRGLLIKQNEIELDAMPGVKASLEAYNGVSSSRERIDTDRYTNFVKSVTYSLRYFIEARNYKSMLFVPSAPDSRLFSVENLVGDSIQPLARGPPLTGNASYAVGNTVQTLITAVESSNQVDEMKKITEIVGDANSGIGRDRDKECILNIIDMNIIPFNVHALMRDVPLANLYNYEFTFDQMVASVYGESSRFIDGGVEDAQTVRTRDMFIRLLMNPYMEVSRPMYGSDTMDLGSGGFVHRIFRGDNDLGLGRPKFLSDQLFNKALFGSTYRSEGDYDEAGPGVGAGISRGRAQIGAEVKTRAGQLLVQAMATLDNIRRAMAAHALNILRPGGFDVGYRNGLVDGNAGANDLLRNMFDYTGVNADTASRDRFVNFDTMRGNARMAVKQFGEAANIISRNREFTAVRDRIVAAITNAGQNTYSADANLGHAVALLEAAGTNAERKSAMDYLYDLIHRVGVLTDGKNDTADIAASRADYRTLSAIKTQFDAVGEDLDNLPATSVAWTRNGTSSIYYLRNPSVNPVAPAVVKVDAANAENVIRLERIGRLRFDTRFVRNLFFITNVLRLVRLKVNRELTHSRNVIVQSHSAIAQSVTEYGFDPYTPNEVYASTLPDSTSRFNDQDDF